MPKRSFRTLTRADLPCLADRTSTPEAANSQHRAHLAPAGTLGRRQGQDLQACQSLASLHARPIICANRGALPKAVHVMRDLAQSARQTPATIHAGLMPAALRNGTSASVLTRLR